MNLEEILLAIVHSVPFDSETQYVEVVEAIRHLNPDYQPVPEAKKLQPFEAMAELLGAEEMDKLQGFYYG